MLTKALERGDAGARPGLTVGGTHVDARHPRTVSAVCHFHGLLPLGSSSPGVFFPWGLLPPGSSSPLIRFRTEDRTKDRRVTCRVAPTGCHIGAGCPVLASTKGSL